MFLTSFVDSSSLRAGPAVDVAILVCWTVLSPLEWERTDIAFDSYQRSTESHGGCRSEDGTVFFACLVIVNLGALAYAVYEAYVARNLSTEFAESENIAKALVLILSVCFLGIPIAIIAQDDSRSNFFVLAGIIFAIALSLLIFVFVPKERHRRRYSLQSGRSRSDAEIVRQSMSCWAEGTAQSSRSSIGDQVLGMWVKDPTQETADLKRELCQLRRQVNELKAKNRELAVRKNVDPEQADPESLDTIRESSEADSSLPSAEGAQEPM